MKNVEIYHLFEQFKELDAQNLTIKTLLEAKIKMKKTLEDEKDEKTKLIKVLQNKLTETQNLFESFTNSLARTLFDKEFKSKYENFMALQKVYGAKVFINIIEYIFFFRNDNHFLFFSSYLKSILLLYFLFKHYNSFIIFEIF